MSRGLADTSLFIARESRRSVAVDDLPEDLAVSVITIGELRAGILAAPDTITRDRRLATLIAIQATQPVPIDESVAEAWARLRVALHEAGRKMPVNDSWIAATAISLDVPVITQDDAYVDVPGLAAMRV